MEKLLITIIDVKLKLKKNITILIDNNRMTTRIIKIFILQSIK